MGSDLGTFSLKLIHLSGRAYEHIFRFLIAASLENIGVAAFGAAGDA
jgi:hypothetical protein